MELASRILSIVLGAAVMVFVLWPVTIPVGFGEVWWASRQAQPRPDTPPAPEPRPKAKPQAAPSASAPPPPPHAVLPQMAEPSPPAPDQAKPRAEQFAALKESDKTGAATSQAVAPQAATKLYRRVTVRDGGTLQADGVIIRLAGIAPRHATCKDRRGQSWRCGAAAKSALARLIRAPRGTLHAAKERRAQYLRRALRGRKHRSLDLDSAPRLGRAERRKRAGARRGG